MKRKYKINGKKITVIHKRTTVSTNTDAMMMPENTLVFADRQTGGKGRLGRSFESPKGGVYMSLSLYRNYSAARLTTAAAVAAAKAAETLGRFDIKIKWVNDLYLENKKICGILAAGNTKNGKISAMVLGLGLNLVEKEPFSAELSKKAGYLFKKGNFYLLRKRFIKAFLEEFYSLLDDNSGTVLNEYTKRDYLLGKTVEFCIDNQTLTGTASGFDKDINLIVKTKDREYRLSFGEARLISY